LKKYLAVCFLALFVVSVSSAQVPSPAHAAMKVSKFTWKGLKAALGTGAFAVEAGIDVAHGALDIANKGLTAVSPVKVLIPVQKFVAGADVVVAKLDSGMEAVVFWGWGVSK
jgi:predicted secreted protein